MPTAQFPFAVRLLGFAPDEAQAVALQLERAPGPGPAYFCLSEHSLQEPDLLIANGDDFKALAALSALTAGAIRPALILGTPALALPYPHLERPLDWDAVYAELAQLVACRADALAKLTAAGMPPLPERRRRERLDLDLTDPADYAAMRRRPVRGTVLVVDHNATFATHLGKLLQPLGIPVEWAGSETEALLTCGARAVSVALIHTAIHLDPYLLCAELRACAGPLQPAVVMLVAPPFVYDARKGNEAGAEGLLDLPVTDPLLRATIKKLMGMA
ncbi:response regulator [Rugamonas apoptosis]|uniref:Response regulator n=1 Tax=Rugamonas apoptosis TaxID=2758570 RepID=A0A7W2FAM9_9BURK|nr:response regulator [Rugamonas apoptosis]MBA5688175.1 response regulator [Rugamonas apoptosis]